MARLSGPNPVAEICKTMRTIHGAQTDAAKKLSIVNVHDREAVLLSFFPSGSAFQNERLGVLYGIAGMRPNHPG